MREFALVVAAVLLSALPLRADDVLEGAELVKKSDCLACHQPTRKVVGPSYVDVAKKYKGKPGAVATLVQKIKKGGSGNWGQIPMSPHPTLKDGDVEKMVHWILASASSPKPAAEPVKEAPKEEAKPAAEEASDDKAAEPAKPKRKKKKKHGAAHHAPAETLAWETDEQVRDLMTKQDCMGCHSGLNAVGEAAPKPWPSFKQVEAKYRQGADVEALVKKARDNAGKNKWGGVPHPTYPGLPEEAVRASVKYILAGKASQAPVAANAADMAPEEWMKSRSDCFTCHQVANKVVGPSYRDVAKKYSDKDVPMLVKKVKNGGQGVWGNVPMTPHANASDEQLEKAVRWILSQK